MTRREQVRYHKMLWPLTALGLLLLAAGLCTAGSAHALWAGLKRIVTAQDVLITDYVALAGLGPALVNAGLVTLIAVALLELSADPLNGSTLATVALMAGFSLFGKNIVNIWPILLGSWLYAKTKREPFSKYVSTAMLATSLAPLVTYAALGGERARLWLGAAVGVVIGFLIPPLAAYTFRIQNGMNLYNTGFACGLLAMVLVSALKAYGGEPQSASCWSSEYHLPLSAAVALVCLGMIAWALIFYGKAAVAGYRHLLRTTGRAPSDYLRAFGTGPVLLNMGVNGLLATGYLLLIGGQMNGATLGGVFAVVGFSAYGKHARNIMPVMAGVLLGTVLNHAAADTPALQLAGLFGTTLAPFSGLFGWPFGVLAGFLHSSVVLFAGSPLEGFNLYNNGFSGGLTAMVLYPVLTALVRHRKPAFQDEEYFDTFQQDSPLAEEQLDAHRDDDMKMPH